MDLVLRNRAVETIQSAFGVWMFVEMRLSLVDVSRFLDAVSLFWCGRSERRPGQRQRYQRYQQKGRDAYGFPRLRHSDSVRCR